jgi:transcriptional regulator with XRE-family HTH domain
MGRKKWSEIRAEATPETLEAAAEFLISMRLRYLREARGLTYSEVADRLEIRQASVSRMESHADVRVRTLRSVIEAMGGTLEIRACFPDADYRLEFSAQDAHVERIPGDDTSGTVSF